jgi:uncharacterized damage-inducible protein DinB
MKHITFTLPAILLLSAAAFAADAPTIAKLYDGQLKGVEREVVPLVEAMPADKMNFAPSAGEFKGVRTFAQQAKHVAAVIYMVAAAAQQEKPPVELGSENGPDSVQTQDQVVKFLKDSFAYAHKAMLSLTDKNQLDMVKSPFGSGEMPRVSLAIIAISHTFDHYGQMVVYARMNGIVPPASR